MSSNSLRHIVEQLRTAAAGQTGAGLSDGELLTHFLSRRDEEAFAALVGRHAPMVWGVCCRQLRNPKDAEDAFQAAFLVLIQKASTIIPREMVANWLYGVAQKTAVRLRASSAKRGWREMQVSALPDPVVSESLENELLSQLDEELTRLPERARALIVLCDLEGHTRKEVARQLGWPEGTVASGLVRARELLAKRLTQRGLAVSGASLAATLAQSPVSADVPPSIVFSTINVATLFASGKAAGVISGDVSTLIQGVLKTMFIKKVLTVSVAMLALGVVVITGGSLAIGQGESKKGDGKVPMPTVVGKSLESSSREPVPMSDGEQSDQARLQGLWQAKSIENQGLKDSNFEEEKYRLRINGDKLTVFADSHTFIFELGTNVEPKTMNLIPEFGKSQGKKLACAIYELDGDMLKICMAIQGDSGKRPKEFKTAPNDGFSLIVYKRLKEDLKEEQKESFTSWGKEVGGLQAGLGFLPAGKRAYYTGENVTVVLRVRNVGKEEAKFSYFREEFGVRPPSLTDDWGNPRPLDGFNDAGSGLARRIDVTLAPGKTVVLSEMPISLRPVSEKGKETPVWKVFGTGWFRLQNYTPGPNRFRDLKTGPDSILGKFATGKLEFEVKEPDEALPEKDALTAWGKEVGGLQAGLGYLPGDTGVYQHGDLNNRKTVNLVVRVRNVSKEVVKFQYIKQFLDEKIPVVTDADGKPVSQANGNKVLGEHGAVDVALKPGAEIILESRMHGTALPFELIPAWSGVTNSNYQPLCLGFGKFRLQFVQVFGNSSAGKIKLDPALEKLVTGKLELEVKAPGPLQIAPKKESKIAWGKEFKGLQSGISILNSEPIHIGDRLQTVVKLRNVSDKPIKVSSRPLWMGYPNVIDSLGKRVNLTRQPVPSNVEIFEATLKPGEVVEAGQSELLVAKIDQYIEIRSGLKLCAIHVDPGKYQVISYGFDGEFVNLATGVMDFEVKPAKDDESNSVTKKIYSPEELKRIKRTPKQRLDQYTVEFKVVAVAKPIKLMDGTVEENAPFTIGHGPDDLGLLSQPLRKFRDDEFSVVLTPNVLQLLKRIGINDPGKHFEGKTIRVSGKLLSYQSAIPNDPNPVLGKLLEMVVEDINQIESVK